MKANERQALITLAGGQDGGSATFDLQIGGRVTQADLLTMIYGLMDVIVSQSDNIDYVLILDQIIYQYADELNFDRGVE